VVTGCQLLERQLRNPIHFHRRQFQVAAVATISLEASDGHNTDSTTHLVVGREELFGELSDERSTLTFSRRSQRLNLGNGVSPSAADIFGCRLESHEFGLECFEVSFDWLSFFEHHERLIFEVTLEVTQAVEFGVHGF
jgi:hypothetical protein